VGAACPLASAPRDYRGGSHFVEHVAPFWSITDIFQDLVRALADGRSPLLLTERTAHLEEFDRRLRAIGKNAIILRGGMGAKQREAVIGQLAAAEGEERVVLATGRAAVRRPPSSGQRQ